MTGVVESHHVLLPVTFRVAGSPNTSIEFVVDTGFVGELTLPVAAVQALGLPYLRDITSSIGQQFAGTS